MSWFSKPKYSTVTVRKNDIPKDVWTKCPISGEIVYNKALQENWMVGRYQKHNCWIYYDVYALHVRHVLFCFSRIT